MKKNLFFVLLFLMLSYILSASQFKNEQSNLKNERISFVNTIQAFSNNSLTKQASNFVNSGENELSKHKNLFLGLTIAFGAGACTFLILGIIFGSVYASVPFGIDYERGRNNNVGVDNWEKASYAMLAGTICVWSLFVFTGILAVATFILYVIAADLFTTDNKNTKKKAMFEIKPSNDNLEMLVSFKF